MRRAALRPLLLAQLCAAVAIVQAGPMQSAVQHLLGLTARFGKSPPRPRFPDNFEVSYTFTLPYVEQYQKGGLRYPIRVWKHKDKLRMDTYNGTNSLITLPGRQIELAPRLDRMHCMLMEDGGGDEPEAPARALLQLQDHSVLPDVGHWHYWTSETVSGRQTDLWVMEQKHESKHVLYKFWVEPRPDEDYDAPVLLTLHGNALDGSHFDEWRYEFSDFKAGPPADSVFMKPELCDGVAVQPLRRGTSHALQMSTLLPPSFTGIGGDPSYNMFVAMHGRRHTSNGEYTQRLGLFHNTLGFIAAHNARPDRSYSVAINKFADWSEEEFRAIMLPGRGLRAQLQQPPPELLHRPVTPPERIPVSVDWQGTGADNVVLDQSACGSCWAFGAAGAMRAAWFMHTGEEVLFSEQELMDCSWGHTHNKACDGGLAEGAFDWVAASGGVSLDEVVPYRGQDDFCHLSAANSTSDRHRKNHKFKGYKAVPEGDDLAVKEAVYTKGPLAVSIDAGQPGFRFYSDGVYDESTCGWRAEELDHSVMLVGYGTTDHGKDFWHVKNSWSTYWGDRGYIKISRDHHGCGVPTNAIYGVPDV